jgi:DNA polymerase-3 subunit gamma/tau
MEAIASGGQSSRLGEAMATESLMRMLEALQASEAPLQKGLSEKVNFEVALLRAVEASQSRALDALIRDLKALDPVAGEKKKPH